MLENPVYGELEETLSIEYSRARASVTARTYFDDENREAELWSRDTIAETDRPNLRHLVDTPDADLGELFTAIAAQCPELIGSIQPDQLSDSLPTGDGGAPDRTDVWAPHAGYKVTRVTEDF